MEEKFVNAEDIAEAEAALSKNEESEPAKESGTEHHHRHHHHRHHHSRKYYKKKRRKRRVKRVLTGVAVGLAALIIITAVVLVGMYLRGKDAVSTENYGITAPANVTVGQRGEYVIYNGEKYTYNKDLVTILFMGIDKYDSQEENTANGTNHRADFIAAGVIDKVNNKISIINVPRDIITDVSVYTESGIYSGVQKLPLATAYSYGDGSDTSCQYTSEAVSRIFFNQPFGIYFALNLDGVPELCDAVDGLDVVSPETIGRFVEGESYHLDGVLASEFVNKRSMERADANLLRNERQKVFMKAFLQKFIERTKQDAGTALSLFNTAEPYSVTNMDADKVTYLATEFIFNSNMQTQFLTVPVDVAQVEDHAENYVRETEFYEQFLSVFYNKE